MDKECKKCKITKSLDSFYFKKSRNKHSGKCRVCVSLERKEYREKNKEAIYKQDLEYRLKNKKNKSEKGKEYYNKNKEKEAVRGKVYRENNKKNINKTKQIYRDKNKDYILKRQRKYEKNKHSTDLSYRIAKNMRCRVRAAIKEQGTYKNSKTMDMIGCSTDDFKKHLEKSFYDREDGTKMTWDFYLKNSKAIHLDHILPCASFDLTDPIQQQKCFNYKNYQLLWAKDNLKKNASLTWIHPIKKQGY